MRRIAAALTVAAALVAALAAPVAATAPLAAAPPTPSQALPARINLPNGWQPEGITLGQGTTIYVGSLVDGSIWRGDARTGKGSVFIHGPGKPAVGVHYDRAGNRLWVTGGPSGEVRVYDAKSGKHLRTYTFAPVGFLNDLAITGSAVYVTDSGIAQLGVIPIPKGGGLAPTSARYTRPLSGAIHYVPNQFNANGLVSTSGWLITVQTSTGKLFKINPKTGATTEIGLGGRNVSGGDGLVLRGSTLWVVRGTVNRVSVVRLTSTLASGQVVRDITSTALDYPSTATLGAGWLWAVNARFSTTPTKTTPYWITRLPTG